jgi:hypothetical protein
MYSNGGQDTPNFGDAVGANAGFSYKGLSVDGYYTKENDAVKASAFGSGVGAGKCDASTPGSCPNALIGSIVNLETWAVMAKYVFELGGSGFKDDEPAGKVTLFGGYAHIEISNPDHTQDFFNGYTTQGGYKLYTGAKAGKGALLYTTDPELDTFWGGASYALGPWTVTGAYYHEAQSQYVDFVKGTCAANTTPGFNNHGAMCAGDLEMASFLVDYRFNKYVDVYAGVSWSGVDGGLANGFIVDSTTNVATGLRLKF